MSHEPPIMKTYAVLVFGCDGGVDGSIEFECDCDQDATNLAFGATSLFGHQLWLEGRFIGWFPGAGPLRVTS